MRRKLPAGGIYETSRVKHGVHLDPDWRYFAFFRLLQISPSYWLAHQLTQGITPARLPADFELVFNTYRMFEEVWSRPYWDWWFDIGQYRFGSDRPTTVRQLAATDRDVMLAGEPLRELADNVTDHYGRVLRRLGLPATVLLSIPVDQKKDVILRQVGYLIDVARAKQGASQSNASFPMLRNKVRDKTVDKAIRAVQARAEYPTRDTTLFALGVRAKLSSAYVKRGKKEAMSQLVSRQLLYAYRLAENAARGRFPSMDKLPEDPNRPVFDYYLLQEQQRAYAKLSWLALQEIPVELRTNEASFAGPNRTIAFDEGPMKQYQIPW